MAEKFSGFRRRPTRFRGILAILLLGGLAASCDEKTASPSETPVLAGNWTGTIQYVVNGTTGVQSLTMNMGQTGTATVGTYNTTTAGYFSGGNATFQGAATPQSFTGTFNFSPSNNPTACSGTFNVSGNSLGTTIAWSSTSVASSCSPAPTSVTINATKL